MKSDSAPTLQRPRKGEGGKRRAVTCPEPPAPNGNDERTAPPSFLIIFSSAASILFLKEPTAATAPQKPWWVKLSSLADLAPSYPSSAAYAPILNMPLRTAPAAAPKPYQIPALPFICCNSGTCSPKAENVVVHTILWALANP